MRMPDLVPPAVATGMVNNLATIQDNMVNLERIMDTPVPFAYQVHLRVSTWYATHDFLINHLLTPAIPSGSISYFFL
jgi:predicted membrane chloride channel (bestrophin family)